jgi:K(+)-stimulated pyrophosphate-energized sodium pump
MKVFIMATLASQIGALWIVPVAAVIAIVLALYFRKIVTKADPGNEAMVTVQNYIKEGADAFMRRQYKVLAMTVAVLAVIIALVYALGEEHRIPWWGMVIAYLFGSISSGLAGWVGLLVGVNANSPTANAAQKGLPQAFNIAYFGGAVMGLLVSGFGIFGIWLLFLITSDPIIILGYSFGASTIALFMKAGGGIFTKTADVGADLVGKIEYTLPEDDARNPAAIADNVGDNVGDIAGMGADLLDSYIASLIAAMLLGFSIQNVLYNGANVYSLTDALTFASFPPVISMAGLFASILGIFIVKRQVSDNPGKALNLGTFLSTGFYIGISALFTLFLTLQAGITNTPFQLAADAGFDGMAVRLWKNWLAGVLGVLAGLAIGITTDYFTDDSKFPTQATAASAQKGHPLVILTGFSYGLYSIAPPTIGIIIAMAVSWKLDGVYAIANSSVGMLAIICTIVSNDAFGPITDNSRGLAEQGKLDESVIAICDKLDSAGNTSKAVTKGFAIGAAALTVLALMYSYSKEAEHLMGSAIEFNLLNADVMIGALFGAAAPSVYSAVLILAVDKNAGKMVDEIRRQFTENPGILDDKIRAKPDYARCVDIATAGALKELIVPICIAIGAPIFIGVFFGVRAVGAFLASSIIVGLVFSLLMGNAGGTWDNAKKYVEEGHFGGKGSLAHAAAVTGDTVGDPFKDTAGPSINTLICVLGLTASMFLPMFVSINGGAGLFVL